MALKHLRTDVWIERTPANSQGPVSTVPVSTRTFDKLGLQFNTIEGILNDLTAKAPSVVFMPGVYETVALVARVP